MARRRRKGQKHAVPVTDGPQALVIEMLGVEALVRPLDAPPESPPERALLARAVSKRSRVVVGDTVQCGLVQDSQPEHPRLMIMSVAPRSNVLARPDFHGRQQAIAANLDHVIVVVTPRDPPLRLGLVDRYLVASFRTGIDPVVCLNKADLDDVGAWEALEPYRALGIPTIKTVALAGKDDGIAPLTDLMASRRSVLVGHSGVGKSSLACALIPGLERRVGTVNQTIGRGRHTTTTASLLPLPQGGELVDTPGIRAFGIFGVEPLELAGFYPEFISRVDECRFRGCSHIHEPGCAVRAAVEEGLIDPGRYERYLQIHRSLVEEGR